MTGSCFIKKLPVLLLTFLVAIWVGLVTVSCGGDETDPTDTSDIKKYDRSKTQQVGESVDTDREIDTEKVREARAMLAKVSLSPQKIQAESTVTIEVETAAPLAENQYLAYIYWKNGKSLEETKEAQLLPLSYKKNDTLFAEVLLYENEELIARKRTAIYIVLNTPPVIEDVILPDVKGPGTYNFIVKAKDVDNDQLTYSLEMDKENTGETSIPSRNAQIDASTGVVTCTLDENLPDSLKFTVAADDGDGGITKKNVAMRFFKRPVKEQ